jgi:hypothetical protein
VTHVLAAVAGGAALLLWPAFVNGDPLVFIDTVSYLRATTVPEPAWDKTHVYGPLLHLFHWRWSLWPPAAVQALMLSHLMWMAQAGATPARHLAICAALAIATSLPWFAATMMPDVLAGVVVLALWLLGFQWHRLRPAERGWTLLLTTLAIAAHLSHLVVAVALLALTLLLARRAAPVLRVAAPIAAAVLLLVATNWANHGRATLSPYGASFLLARLQADGPAAATLREACPGAGWHLCAFAGRLPMDSDEFLWDGSSPLNREADGTPRAMGALQGAPEARAIIAETLRRHPLEVAQAMAGNALTQLTLVEVGDTLAPTHLDLSARRPIRDSFPARELAAFDAGRQRQGTLDAVAAPLRPLHLAALALALAVLLWRHRLSPLTLCVLVGLAANAFATGALSKPHHRYQARIVWILPLAALLPGGLRPPTPAGVTGSPRTPPA